MGSCSYDRDVYSSSSYSSWGTSAHSEKIFNRNYLEDSLKPNGKKIISNSKNPIIIVLDVTGSNIDFAKLVYDKLPMFYGEIESKKYLEDFDLCICAVGDAYTDDYPIQIGTPAKGIEIDSWIEKLVLESRGGGQSKESYELMAHYLLNSCEFKQDAKPILFFIGDEAPYPNVNIKQASEIGLPIEKEYSPWDALNRKFGNSVYLMLNKYCGRNFDSEITNAWERVLCKENIINIHEEKGIVDLMLGVIALKKEELDSYIIDMKNRGQTLARIEGVSKSLEALANSTSLVKIEGEVLPDVKRLTLKPNNRGKRL